MSAGPKKKILYLALVSAAVLLSCQAATGLLATPTPYPTQTPYPTFTPRPTSTPTPTHTPTPTDTPSPTETPLVTDTPSPTPTEELFNLDYGEVVFFDDFSNTSSGWDRYSDSDGITDYFEDQYLIGIYTTSFLFWANPYLDLTDVIIEVDATKAEGGDDNQMGIICRHQDVDNFYALVIGSDGLSAIRKRYQGGDLEVLTDGWIEGPSIDTGSGAFNQIRAECIGTRLSLYANGELIVEVNDADIPSGDVGLLAGTFEIPSLEVLFDNFIVYEP